MIIHLVPPDPRRGSATHLESGQGAHQKRKAYGLRRQCLLGKNERHHLSGLGLRAGKKELMGHCDSRVPAGHGGGERVCGGGISRESPELCSTHSGGEWEPVSWAGRAQPRANAGRAREAPAPGFKERCVLLSGACQAFPTPPPFSLLCFKGPSTHSSRLPL